MNKFANKYGLIIIGSGAAGLAAAVYAGRYLIKTLIIAGEFGGETATAGAIENYPGYSFIDGFDLVNKIKEQAQKSGAELVEGWVSQLKKEGDCFKVVTDQGEEFLSQALIFAFGSQRRHLGLAKEKELTGKGVHYCVTCDGPLFGNKVVAMVGGGDSSVKGVNFLGDYAKKIYFIVRDKEIKAEPINLERMKRLSDKVELLLENQVQELVGDKKLEKIILSKPYQSSNELAIDGLFIEIGFQPNTELPKQLGVELDEKGYIKVDHMMRTNVLGVFAAGDCTNHFGSFKQDITAAALGSVASTSAYEYSKIAGDICPWHAKPSRVSKV